MKQLLCVTGCLAVIVLAGCVPSPAAWSPDSAQVAFVTTAPPPDGGLWIGDVAAETCRQAYRSGRTLSGPAWSPDGKLLAVCEAPEKGTAPVALVIAGGEGEPKRIELADVPMTTGDDGHGSLALLQYPVSWRPDGGAIGMTVPAGEDGCTVSVVGSAGGKLLWRKPGLAYCSWSPDGKSVASLRYGDDEMDVVLTPADGGETKLVCRLKGKGEGGFPRQAPVWSPDGKRLCVTAANVQGAKGTAVWVVDVAKRWADCISDGDVAGSASWTGDGKRVVCALVLADDWEDGPDHPDIVAIDPETHNRTVLVAGRIGRSGAMATSCSPDGKWIAWWSRPCRIEKDGPGSYIVRLVGADGKAEKAFYTSDARMLAMVEGVVKEARGEKEAGRKSALCKLAGQMLDEIPKRFPRTELRERIEDARDEIAEIAGR